MSEIRKTPMKTLCVICVRNLRTFLLYIDIVRAVRWFNLELFVDDTLLFLARNKLCTVQMTVNNDLGTLFK